jgi:hypothetical protein
MNKEELAARKRRYYEEHKEEVAAWQRRYREEHKEELAARKRRYREEHRKNRALPAIGAGKITLYEAMQAAIAAGGLLEYRVLEAVR